MTLQQERQLAQLAKVEELKYMDKKELRKEFIRIFGEKETIPDNRGELMEMIIKGEWGEPSAPTKTEIAKSKKKLTRKRGGRINTP